MISENPQKKIEMFSSTKLVEPYQNHLNNFNQKKEKKNS